MGDLRRVVRRGLEGEDAEDGNSDIEPAEGRLRAEDNVRSTTEGLRLMAGVGELG